MSRTQERAIAAVVSLAVAAWCGAMLAVPLHDGDLWFHLSGGRHVFEKGGVPRIDELTLARAGTAWIDLHWGFQVLVYSVYGAFGYAGLSVLACAFGAAIAGATMLAAKTAMLACDADRTRAALAAPFAALPWIPAFALRPVLRPELATYLLLALALAALAQFARSGSKRAACCACGLQILLANVQGLFVLGWLLAVAFLAPLLFDRRRRRGAVVLGLALLAAPLANPYAFEGWIFPWLLLSRIDGSAPVFARIAEFTGSLLRNELTAWTWWIFAALVAIGAAFALRSKPRWLAFAIAATGCAALFLAFQARRNLSFAALAAAFALAPVLARCARQRSLSFASALLGVIAVCAAFDAAGPSRFHGFRHVTRTGLGIASESFPVATVERVRRSGYAGPLFCDLNVGAFVAFELARPVLVDARLEVLGREGLETYFDLLADAGFFERTCARFGLGAAVFDVRAPHTRPLLDHVARSSGWTAAALDGPWALFVRAEASAADSAPQRDLLGDPAALRRWERHREQAALARERTSRP